MTDVKEEQSDLNQLGVSPQLTVDGVDGPKTDADIDAQLNKDVAALGGSTPPVKPPVNITGKIFTSKGADLYQDAVNFPMLYKALVTTNSDGSVNEPFVIIKSGDGSTTRAQWNDDFPVAKAAGFKAVGAYHFFQPGVSVQAQINVIVAQAKAVGWQAGVDLPFSLDFETFSSSDGPTAADWANAYAIIQQSKESLGLNVAILYASNSYLANAPAWVFDTTFVVLWDAIYGGQPSVAHLFFQNSGTASIGGLNGGAAESDSDIESGPFTILQWIASTAA